MCRLEVLVHAESTVSPKVKVNVKLCRLWATSFMLQAIYYWLFYAHGG